MRYSASKNSVTLKTLLGVVQGLHASMDNLYVFNFFTFLGQTIKL